MNNLYRLIYASRNLLQGALTETAPIIQKGLEAYQRNNTQVGVTGALMVNDAIFAQVLEGPRRGVEDIFTRVPNDRPHGDVAVLRREPALDRCSIDCAMMLVGQSAHG